MKAIIRKDEQAVSPVIATILMVAITVVLAAVLYVMVSGLITSPGSTPKAMGVNPQKSSDGTNWVLTVTSAPTGLTAGAVTLTVLTGSGSTYLSGLLSGMTNTTWKYQPAGGGSVSTTTTVSAGDAALLSTTYFKTGFQVQFTSSGTILYSGTLR